MKLSALILGAVLSSASLASFAQTPAPIVIKFSHVVAADTPKGKGAEKFKELAEEPRPRGRVKIEVYANSVLYKDKEEMEALQLGAVQMLAPSLAKFGPLGVKEFEVFDLPYIFPDRAALEKVENGPVGAMLFKKLETKGIKGLAYWDNGFKVMSANKPIHMPDDFKGLKMRIQSSKVLEAQMRALGALPQVLAFSEVYQALQTGVVDGTENPPSNLYTQKMNEVQKYVAVSNHGYLGYAVIVNKKFWDDLPADIRTALEGAMKDATKYTNDIAEKENARRAREGQGDRQDAGLRPDRRRDGGVEEGVAAGAGRDEVADRQGHGRGGPEGNRRREVVWLGSTRPRPGRPESVAPKREGERAHAERILNHLEEWLIAALMGAATLLIFVAVVHRYASGIPVHPGLRAEDQPELGAGTVHLHVRVDGQVRRGLRRSRRRARRRRRADRAAADRVAQVRRLRRDLLRHVLHGRHRLARTALHLGERHALRRLPRVRPRHRRPARRPDDARPRVADVVDLLGGPDGLVPDVLPLHPGRPIVLADRRDAEARRGRGRRARRHGDGRARAGPASASLRGAHEQQRRADQRRRSRSASHRRSTIRSATTRGRRRRPRSG